MSRLAPSSSANFDLLRTPPLRRGGCHPCRARSPAAAAAAGVLVRARLHLLLEKRRKTRRTTAGKVGGGLPVHTQEAAGLSSFLCHNRVLGSALLPLPAGPVPEVGGAQPVPSGYAHVLYARTQMVFPRATIHFLFVLVVDACVLGRPVEVLNAGGRTGERRRDVDFCGARDSPAPWRSQPRVAGLGGGHVRVSQRVLCGAGRRGVAVRPWSATTTSRGTGGSQGGQEWWRGGGGRIVCRELSTVSREGRRRCGVEGFMHTYRRPPGDG